MFILYLIVYVVMWFTVAWFILNEEARACAITSDDVRTAFGVGLIWPISLIIYVAVWINDRLIKYFNNKYNNN